MDIFPTSSFSSSRPSLYDKYFEFYNSYNTNCIRCNERQRAIDCPTKHCGACCTCLWHNVDRETTEMRSAKTMARLEFKKKRKRAELEGRAITNHTKQDQLDQFTAIRSSRHLDDILHFDWPKIMCETITEYISQIRSET